MKYLFLVPLLFGALCAVMLSDVTTNNSGVNTPKILDKYLIENWENPSLTLDASGNRIVRPAIHYWLKTPTGDKEVGKGEWEKIILR